MDPAVPELELDNLRAIKVLGKGATGTVLLAHDKSRDPYALSPFALKIIPKSSPHHADRRARWELSVLTRLSDPTRSHPSLPTLLGSFETRHVIGWATPFCPGGDLNALRFKNPDRCFSPMVIKFYLAEIVCALDHLHTMGIVYRDLKPENILVQQSGHLTLTDFDLSRACHVTDTCQQSRPKGWAGPVCQPQTPRLPRWWSRSRVRRVSPLTRRRSSTGPEGKISNYSFVGTEEYVSPEMVRGGPHGFGVDWWALGILAYEMLYGTTPFKGRNKKETFSNVLTKEVLFVGRPTALTCLIRWLLEKDPNKRAGYDDIKQHEFFSGVRWDLLTEVSRPPIIPLWEEENVTEEDVGNGVDVREYFAKLLETSPVSIVHEYKCNISLTEF